MTSKVKCEYISGKDNMVRFSKMGKLTVQDIRDKIREIDLGPIAMEIMCDRDSPCGLDDDTGNMDR